MWKCLDNLITEKFSTSNDRQSDPCVVKAMAGRRDSWFLKDTPSDQITWASRSGWHHDKRLGEKTPGEVSGTQRNTGIWMTAVTQTTDQVLLVHTEDWETKGKGLVFNLVQLLLLAAHQCYSGPRVCRGKHAQPSGGSLVAAWHTLGTVWAAGTTFTSLRPFTRSCSVALSY